MSDKDGPVTRVLIKLMSEKRAMAVSELVGAANSDPGKVLEILKLLEANGNVRQDGGQVDAFGGRWIGVKGPKPERSRRKRPPDAPQLFDT